MRTVMWDVKGRGLAILAFISCFLLICVLLLPGDVQSRNDVPVFCTGHHLELDRVASAWLIKRYVAPDAVFKFVADGELVTEGTAFDTPDAALQRTHKLSSFEVIKGHYDIADPKLDRLTQLVHQNKINFWAGTKRAQSSELVQKINQIIAASTEKHACL